MKKPSHLLNKLLEIRNQMKLYHWQTEQHGRHIAADKFLDKAEDIIDSIIEAYQGKYKTIELDSDNKEIKLHNIKDKDIEKYLKTVRDFLVKDYEEYIDKDEDTDLLNLRDELIAGINITLYLFRQK